MKKSFVNNTHVEGYIFSHDLQKRTSQKGVDYIGGSVNVAVDEEATNVVTVRFTYVTPTYAKSGKTNETYNVLAKIIEDNNTYEANGINAQKIRIDGRVDVNDFVSRTGEIASPKQFSGSFAHFMNPADTLSGKATFEADMLIANVSTKERNDGTEYDELRGYVFNFRNDVLPVTFSIDNEAGMKYFEEQDISSSSPLLTKVWGEIISTIIKNETEVESAFGAPTVNVTTRTIRAWNVVGAAAEPMEWDDESTITKSELKKALADREEHLADVKKRWEERNNGGNAFSAETKKKVAAAVSAPDPTDDDDFEF